MCAVELSKHQHYICKNVFSCFPFSSLTGCSATKSPGDNLITNLTVMENSSVVLPCAAADGTGKLESAWWCFRMNLLGWSEDGRNGILWGDLGIMFR